MNKHLKGVKVYNTFAIAMGMVASMGGHNAMKAMGKLTRTGNQWRPCLNGCGIKHQENNAFCSAKCCKGYRLKKK